MAEKTKPWYASKTIWLNAVTAGVAVLTALQGQSIVQDNPSLAAGLVAALGAANVALRIISILPIG